MVTPLPYGDTYSPHNIPPNCDFKKYSISIFRCTWKMADQAICEIYYVFW